MNANLFHQWLHLVHYDVWRLRGWLMVWAIFFVLGLELILPAGLAWAPLPLAVFKFFTIQPVESFIALLQYLCSLVLLVVVIQLHPGMGRGMVWATLPIPRGLLFLSKLSSYLLFLLLPVGLAHGLCGLLINRADLGEVASGVGLEMVTLTLWSASIAWLAIQSAGFPGFLVRFIVLIVVICAYFIILTWKRPFSSSADAGVFHRVLMPLVFTTGLWATVYLQYARLRTGLTLAAGGVTMALAIWFSWNQGSDDRVLLPEARVELAGLPVQRVTVSTARTASAGGGQENINLTLDPALLAPGEFLGDAEGSYQSTHFSQLGYLRRYEALRAMHPGAKTASETGQHNVEEDRLDLALIRAPNAPRYAEVPVCRLEEIGRVRFGQLLRWRENGVPQAAWNELGIVTEDRFYYEQGRRDFGWEPRAWSASGVKLTVVTRPDLNTVWFPEVEHLSGEVDPGSTIGTYAVTLRIEDTEALREVLRTAEVVMYRAKPVRVLAIDFKKEDK